MQSFTACMPLLMATSALGLRRRCCSSQHCYLQCCRGLEQQLTTNMTNYQNMNNKVHVPGESNLEEHRQAPSAGAASVFLVSHRSMERHCQHMNTNTTMTF